MYCTTLPYFNTSGFFNTSSLSVRKIKIAFYRSWVESYSHSSCFGRNKFIAIKFFSYKNRHISSVYR